MLGGFPSVPNKGILSLDERRFLEAGLLKQSAQTRRALEVLRQRMNLRRIKSSQGRLLQG